MSRKIQLLGLGALTLLSFGCSSSSPQATAEEKKAFMGGPMPKDFMQKYGSQMKGPSATGPGGAAPGAPAAK
jgi:hypothetical protein